MTRTCGTWIRNYLKGTPYPFPISTFFLLFQCFTEIMKDGVFPILGVKIPMCTIQSTIQSTASIPKGKSK